MEENGLGRTCEQCDKTVYDFRGRSQGEINNIVSVHNGELCAIVDAHKVNEPSQNISGWKGMRLMRRFALCVFAVFGSALFSFGSTHAERVAKTVHNLGYEQLKSDPKNTFVVKGKVNNATENEGLGMVSIILLVDSVEVGGTTTDYNGEFVLQTSNLTKEDWANAKMVFTYMGFGTQEVDTFDFGMDNITYVQVDMEFEAVLIESIEVEIHAGANYTGVIRTGTIVGGLSRVEIVEMFPDTDRSEDVDDFNDDF